MCQNEIILTVHANQWNKQKPLWETWTSAANVFLDIVVMSHIGDSKRFEEVGEAPSFQLSWIRICLSAGAVWPENNVFLTKLKFRCSECVLQRRGDPLRNVVSLHLYACLARLGVSCTVCIVSMLWWMGSLSPDPLLTVIRQLLCVLLSSDPADMLCSSLMSLSLLCQRVCVCVIVDEGHHTWLINRYAWQSSVGDV